MHRNTGGFTEEAQGRLPGEQTGFLQGRLYKGVLGERGKSTCKGVCLPVKSIRGDCSYLQGRFLVSKCINQQVMTKSCFWPKLKPGTSEPSSQLGLHLSL